MFVILLALRSFDIENLDKTRSLLFGVTTVKSDDGDALAAAAAAGKGKTLFP